MQDGWHFFVQNIRHRLQAPLPGYEAQKKMMRTDRPTGPDMPPSARQSAVLVLLYPEMGRPHIVLIQRAVGGGVHSGQIALPGGKKEDTDETLADTALREAHEEVALLAKDVSVMGLLSPLYIPVSNFVVNPVLAVCHQPPVLTPSDYEVAAIITPALNELFARKEAVSVRASEGVNIKTMAYAMRPEKTIVWGATAMILSELEELLDGLY
ncbi:MAG: CoA pyrophosphatase [Edaphocola sp.]